MHVRGREGGEKEEEDTPTLTHLGFAGLRLLELLLSKATQFTVLDVQQLIITRTPAIKMHHHFFSFFVLIHHFSTKPFIHTCTWVADNIQGFI